MEEQLELLMDGWMSDGCIGDDGWMDGWMDG